MKLSAVRPESVEQVTTKLVTLEFGDLPEEVLNVRLRLTGISDETARLFREAEEGGEDIESSEQYALLICDLVAWWDAEDKQGNIVPLTVDALLDKEVVPTDLLAAMSILIRKKIEQLPFEKETSSGTSSSTRRTRR